jgi:hypothetical protein
MTLLKSLMSSIECHNQNSLKNTENQHN